MKSMKSLLKKCDGSLPRFREALLVWRNKPKDHGFSPAQLFFGLTQNRGQRPLSDPFTDRGLASSAKLQREASQSSSYDRNTRSIGPLSPGTRVFLRDPKSSSYAIPGTITSTRDSGRSYLVALDSGDSTSRNRPDVMPIAA